SGNIVGFEALLRWNHPDRGMLPPGLFIPLAEQTELIHSIGKWVIREACRQNMEWQDKGYPPVVVAINLSVEQFRNRRLTSMIAEELAISRLMPEYLDIEITESIAIHAPDYIISILKQFKALGVSISIDDFGTEYSSLSRLKDLPIDNLKIAMEFIRGIGRSSRDDAIAGAIVNLAKSLDLKTIAEGVETEEQLAFMQENSCDIIQGFYYYRPMPAREAEQLLQKSKALKPELK
ncbi:MAG: EAL domain-containing protein, partial [Clostridiaceae bacterium]|nr:EAL domain-containing protein [Clostridiaceae bacterium]